MREGKGTTLAWHGSTSKVLEVKDIGSPFNFSNLFYIIKKGFLSPPALNEAFKGKVIEK